MELSFVHYVFNCSEMSLYIPIFACYPITIGAPEGAEEHPHNKREKAARF